MSGIVRIIGRVAQLHPKSNMGWSRSRVARADGSSVWCVAKFGVDLNEMVDFNCKLNEKFGSYDVLDWNVNTTPNSEAIAIKLQEIASGVGKVKARKLVEVEDLWARLESEPEKVAAMINVSVATLVNARAEMGKEQEGLSRLGELVRLGYTPKIAKQLGRIDAHYRLALKSPYSVIPFVEGFGWKMADAVGVKMKIPKNEPSRLIAGVNHYWFTIVSNNGHTRVTLKQILEELPDLLEVRVGEVHNTVVHQMIPVTDDVGQYEWYTMPYAYNAEQSIARAFGIA